MELSLNILVIVISNIFISRKKVLNVRQTPPPPLPWAYLWECQDQRTWLAWGKEAMEDTVAMEAMETMETMGTMETMEATEAMGVMGATGAKSMTPPCTPSPPWAA